MYFTALAAHILKTLTDLQHFTKLLEIYTGKKNNPQY